MMFYRSDFYYKALHGKVSINNIDKINRMLTLWVGHFWPHGYIVNKPGRVLLADATYQISKL